MANIVGPKISFNGKTVMSNVHNNVGSGLNIVLVSAESGVIEDVGSFNMYSEKVDPLLLFLKKIQKSTVVLLASFDDPVTRMSDEVRETFASLGSHGVKSLSLRDAWIFVGGPGMEKPFEKVEKNQLQSNALGGWPGVIEVEGCLQKKIK
ncbi:protein FAM3C-like [Aplochiton taeniatus]